MRAALNPLSRVLVLLALLAATAAHAVEVRFERVADGWNSPDFPDTSDDASLAAAVPCRQGTAEIHARTPA